MRGRAEDLLAAVKSSRTLAPGVTEIELELPGGVEPRPGQFLHISTGETFLRRPFSIAGFDRSAGTVRIIVRDVGRGSRIISGLRAGDRVRALAPLGNSFPMDEITGLLEAGSGVWLVGGGIGIAPLLFAASEIREKAFRVDSFIGFRDNRSVIKVEEFEACGNVSLSVGGLVTDALARAMEGGVPGLILACGPTPMLRALREICLDRGISGYVSAEERMGCGIGACLACACRASDRDGRAYRRVCRDGPVFGISEVIL
ncbi:MAG: dihydroorotate dehydrogenase electron transfer subunit [Synergistaceae bacterium]|jgi:dihydroorotate dehydrogenase electron transfer subunit|nr:dihydroorotate dehydrogenase electron transfer subunit [Synergistaceae bacterium]